MMRAKIMYKRTIFLSILILLIILIQISPFRVYTNIYYHLNPEKSIYCYNNNMKSPTLPEFQFETDLDRSSGAIFFHETSCFSHLMNNNEIFINARQACAVESAAKLNPNTQIFLLYTSPGIISNNSDNNNNNESDSAKFLGALLSYKNIKIRHIDFAKYLEGSPIEHIYKGRMLEHSFYAQSHASDVLRYLTLWRFGGTYLDLDVIVTKSLEDLQSNYAGSESIRNVAAGILNFSPTGLGHNFAQSCLNDLARNFRGREWGANGPGVITRFLQQICGVKDAGEMIHKYCNGFHVYPPKYFYPIRWQDWKMYFDETRTEEVMELARDSYIVHVWNMHSAEQLLPIDSKAAYVVYAKKFCPRVFHQSQKYF